MRSLSSLLTLHINLTIYTGADISVQACRFVQDTSAVVPTVEPATSTPSPDKDIAVNPSTIDLRPSLILSTIDLRPSLILSTIDLCTLSPTIYY